MKQLLKLAIISIILLISSSTYAQKKIFLKEFEFKLEQVSQIDYENEYFITITLNKNSMYLFEIMNNVGDFAGDAIVEILEGEKVLATNIVGDQYFKNFVFKCTKTGYYDIIIKFKNNTTGSSIVKLYLQS